jgi:hypothetical protein
MCFDLENKVKSSLGMQCFGGKSIRFQKFAILCNRACYSVKRFISSLYNVPSYSVKAMTRVLLLKNTHGLFISRIDRSNQIMNNS